MIPTLLESGILAFFVSGGGVSVTENFEGLKKKVFEISPQVSIRIFFIVCFNIINNNQIKNLEIFDCTL